MPVDKASGTENLRADAQVYSGPPTASPSGKGTDAGGDTTNSTTLSGSDKPTPTSYSHDVPDGLQTFDDNGQKDGGTKYMGR